jgi:hypothetical protein
MFQQHLGHASGRRSRERLDECIPPTSRPANLSLSANISQRPGAMPSHGVSTVAETGKPPLSPADQHDNTRVPDSSLTGLPVMSDPEYAPTKATTLPRLVQAMHFASKFTPCRASSHASGTCAVARRSGGLRGDVRRVRRLFICLDYVEKARLAARGRTFVGPKSWWWLRVVEDCQAPVYRMLEWHCGG